MGNLTFKASWNQDLNNATADLLSADEFKGIYLWGLPLCNPTTGQSLSDNTISFYLKAVTELVEKTFSIKVNKQIIQETLDYVREEFYSFGYVLTTYPINKAYELVGQLSRQQLISYPVDWLTIKHDSGGGIGYRNLYIVPTGYGSTTFVQGYYAYQTYFNFFGQRFIPNYWQPTYCTGFDIIPEALLNLICKWAAIPILLQLEFSIQGMGGYSFGMASESLSLDGMSQSMSKMNGGNIFAQRIRQYYDEVKTMWPILKSDYGGITFGVC